MKKEAEEEEKEGGRREGGEGRERLWKVERAYGFVLYFRGLAKMTS